MTLCIFVHRAPNGAVTSIAEQNGWVLHPAVPGARNEDAGASRDVVRRYPNGAALELRPGPAQHRNRDQPSAGHDRGLEEVLPRHLPACVP